METVKTILTDPLATYFIGAVWGILFALIIIVPGLRTIVLAVSLAALAVMGAATDARAANRKVVPPGFYHGYSAPSFSRGSGRSTYNPFSVDYIHRTERMSRQQQAPHVMYNGGYRWGIDNRR